MRHHQGPAGLPASRRQADRHGHIPDQEHRAGQAARRPALQPRRPRGRGALHAAGDARETSRVRAAEVRPHRLRPARRGQEQPGLLRAEAGRGELAAAVQEGDVRQGRRLGARRRQEVQGEDRRQAPPHHHPQHRARHGPAAGGPRREEDLVRGLLVRHVPGLRLHPALPRPGRPVRTRQRGRPGARLARDDPVVGGGRRARVRPVGRVDRRAFAAVRARGHPEEGRPDLLGPGGAGRREAHRGGREVDHRR